MRPERFPSMAKSKSESREYGLQDGVRGVIRRGIATMILGMLAGAPLVGHSQQPVQQTDASGTFTMKVQTDIVLTNVVVRDKKTGEVVKGLKESDFNILENGKPQKIASFDYQNVDAGRSIEGKCNCNR